MRTWIFAATALGIVATHSLAPACFVHSPLPVELIEDHITIEVTDQVATKQYTCTFYNPNQGSVEGGTCYMEVEPGAQVDHMTLQIEGREVQAEILDADRAREVFQEILARGGSPALLEFYGNGLVRAQVPRIPPMGKVTAVLRYTTYLRSEAGLFRMRVLNTNPKAWLKPLKKVTVEATIRSREEIKSVYSPTHDMTVERVDDHHVKVRYEKEDYLPRTPLALYWHVAPGALGMGAIAYRDDEERGYFMLMISPDVATDARPVPKDVVFCVDTSGSMAREDRFAQVQRALRACLGRLDRRDRFNVVSFGIDVRSFAKRPVEATGGNVRRAVEGVEALEARGTSSLEAALEESLGQFEESDRPRYVVFLTDGHPGGGEREIDALIARMKELNRYAARIFTIGVGDEVNMKLLDLMAEDSGGSSDYVMPRESVEERLLGTYAKIAHPVLTDVRIRFEGVRVEEVYPTRLPDLFKGGQLVVFGRYRRPEGSTAGKVALTGRMDGRSVAREYPLDLPAFELTSDFLPRIWAGRKVAHLLEELKREGDDPESVRTITRLAKQFGIVTPYTSYLVTDDIISHGSPVGEDFEEEVFKGNLSEASALSFRPSGRLSIGWKVLLREDSLQRLPALDELAEESTGRTAKEVMQKVRTIGPKTFYLSDGVWYEGTYDPKLHREAVQVAPGSAEFKQLIDRLPGLAKYFSLTKVVVLYRGQVYRVG